MKRGSLGTLGTHRFRRLVAVALIAALIIAGGIGVWYFVVTPLTAPSGYQPRADGPTFYQVLSNVNGSVSAVSGGPWFLVSVVGVASPTPYSPNVDGYPNLNLTVNGCQAQFNGLTLWNGSIPLFDGTFDSGTAPFWQLAYYSPSSQLVLIATSASGTPRVTAPMPLSSDCALAWATFRNNPDSWLNQIYANGTLPVDSSVAAMVAWNNLDQKWIRQNAPLAEVYELGPGMFIGTGDVYDGNWEVYFMGCGVAGYSGVRPLYAAGVSRTGDWGGPLNLTRNCVTLHSQGPVIDRGENRFFFSTPNTSGDASSTWVEAPYQIGEVATNGSFYGFYDAFGVADWMVALSLTTTSGEYLPLAAAGCPQWVASPSACVANSSGWYVVLLSAGGEWLASFGVTAGGGAGWTVPVTAKVSHQSPLIIMPSTWSPASDVLTVNSTVSGVDIYGSVAL